MSGLTLVAPHTCACGRGALFSCERCEGCEHCGCHCAAAETTPPLPLSTASVTGSKNGKRRWVQPTLTPLAADSDLVRRSGLVLPKLPTVTVTSAPLNKTRWPLFTPEDLISAPPPAWLVQDYLAEGELSVLYGRWGSGKSFLALAWAAAIATGTPWLGRTTKPGPVLYVAPEGGKGGWGKRLAAWTTHHQQPVRWDNLKFVRAAVNLYRGEHRALVDELRASGYLRTRPVLIVIDTQARCMVGADEDRAKDMGLYVAGCDYLREQLGCHVLNLHHTPKEALDARGSGALHGAADAMLSVEMSGKTVTVVCTKVKDGEDLPDLALQLVKVPGTASCVLVPPSVANLSPITQRLLGMVGSSQIPVGTTLGKWGEDHGISHGSAYRSQDELVDGGYVTKGEETWTLTNLGQEALSHSSQAVP